MLNYDMKNLKHLGTLQKQAPATMIAFGQLNDAVFADGALDAKTKELIALAVAIAKQCPYCIEVHQGSARKQGATDEELSEAALVAAAIGAGAAVTHATHIFE